LIIDAHAHVVAPEALYAYKGLLLADRGSHGRTQPNLSDEAVERSAQECLAIMDSVGTDVQLLSPRPFHGASSERPAKIVHWWTEAVNDVIARQVKAHPDRFAGVVGLPQQIDEPVTATFEELERRISDDGFVGALLNPDPAEGTAHMPPFGDEYWYPLWEKLVELDVPALVHGGGCNNGRESYSSHFITEGSIAILSLLSSRVFLDFPDLRLVISHGGGSVPYQIGRWRAARHHPRLRLADALDESFDASLQRLFFDTVLHDAGALAHLVATVGADRCLFATEKPGSGSAKNPETGRDYDDLKPVIEGLPISDDEKRAIFEGNTLRVFTRLEGQLARAA
jgi:4-oxalmesaconate hydratase